MCSSAFLLSHNVGLPVKTSLEQRDLSLAGETKEKENARSSTVVFDILTAIKSSRESLRAADWEAQYQRSFGLPLMYHFLALWPWADGLSLPSFLTYKMVIVSPFVSIRWDNARKQHVVSIQKACYHHHYFLRSKRVESEWFKIL